MREGRGISPASVHDLLDKGLTSMETLHVHDGAAPSFPYLSEVQTTHLLLLLADLGYAAGFEAVRDTEGHLVPDTFKVDEIVPEVSTEPPPMLHWTQIANLARLLDQCGYYAVMDENQNGPRAQVEAIVPRTPDIEVSGYWRHLCNRPPRGLRRPEHPGAAVDSGRLVIIDPCYLGSEGEDAALHYVERGLAVLVDTGGDGMCQVHQTDDDDGNTAIIIEPAPHQHPHTILDADDVTRWHRLTRPDVVGLMSLASVMEKAEMEGQCSLYDLLDVHDAEEVE
jgi:hypothetical protein